jgi:hypothetical protein
VRACHCTLVPGRLHMRRRRLRRWDLGGPSDRVNQRRAGTAPARSPGSAGPRRRAVNTSALHRKQYCHSIRSALRRHSIADSDCPCARFEKFFVCILSWAARTGRSLLVTSRRQRWQLHRAGRRSRPDVDRRRSTHGGGGRRQAVRVRRPPEPCWSTLGALASTDERPHSGRGVPRRARTTNLRSRRRHPVLRPRMSQAT